MGGINVGGNMVGDIAVLGNMIGDNMIGAITIGSKCFPLLKNAPAC